MSENQENQQTTQNNDNQLNTDYIKENPDKIMDYIKDLRDENAGKRTKFKSLSEELESYKEKEQEREKQQKEKQEQELIEQKKYEDLLKNKDTELSTYKSKSEQLEQEIKSLREFKEKVMNADLEKIQDKSVRESLKKTGDINLIREFLKREQRQENSGGASDNKKGMTVDSFRNLSFADRQKIAQENPALYEKMQYELLTNNK